MQNSLGNYVGKVSAPAIATYAYLQSIAVNGEVIITAKKLAAAIKKAVPTVRDHLSELEQAGLIQVESRHDEELGTLSNRYKLLV